VAERLGSFLGIGFFSASATGILVYRTGTENQWSQLTWLDRQGMVLGPLGDPGFYTNLALSPDGARVAVSRGEFQTNARDVWLIESGAGKGTRFTLGPERAGDPVWSPDGSRLVMQIGTGEPSALQVWRANGAEGRDSLLKAAGGPTPTSWSSDGRFVLYTATDPKTNADVWVVPLDGERKPIPFLHTEFNEGQGRFSPNARWVAYQSDESGRYEVYVRPFSPDSSAGKVLVSRGGGSEPHWRKDGKEIVYRTSDGTLFAVDVTTNSGFEVGAPKRLFKSPALDPQGRATQVARLTINWDMTPNADRFLVAFPVQEGLQTPFTAVINWHALLQER
jgi:Tol biopolymer transport system component